jgi:N-acetylmuramoyl-L-alanine amidase/Secretion system C-terminal sorting domain
MKNFKLVAFAFFFYSGIFAQDEKSYSRLMQLPITKEIKPNGDVFLQGNFTEILTGKKSLKELQPETIQTLNVANAPHPNVETIRNYLKEASVEFNVPLTILDAIAKTYNNYAMFGVSGYGSFGMMGLVENEVVNTAKQASELTGIKIEDLKQNPREQVRGAAALLSFYAGKNKQSKNELDWFDAVKQFSGMIDDETKEMQAISYFEVMNNGKNTITLWKEKAIILPLNNVKISNLINTYNSKVAQANTEALSKGAVAGTVDYPGANAAFTDCNFGIRNGFGIDTYVNHYISEGTVASTISFFRLCRPNAPTSAHFLVGQNGQVYQMVKVASNAFHCGAIGSPNNNHRSIGTEHEVVFGSPDGWNTPALLTASTNLARYFCNLYNISKTRSLPGIRGHQEMPNSNTDCPYTIPWTTWMNMLLNNGTVNNTPVTVSPASGATNVGLPVTLTYTSPVNANAFRIQVSTSNTGWTDTNGFTTNTAPSSTIVVNASITGLSFNWAEGVAGIFEGPKSSKTYYYTVRSFDTTTGTSKYSAVKSFSTVFGVQPTLPLNAASVTSPVTVSWTSTTASASYRLQISKVNSGWTAANGFTTDVNPTTNVPVNYSAANLLSYAWPNAGTTASNQPVVGATYYWTVRLYSATTGSSNYSPVRSFTISGTARMQTALKNELRMFPNPSNGEISFSYESKSENAEMFLYDLKGNMVFSKKYQTQKGDTTLKETVFGLIEGNYILKIIDGENILSQNVIIQNK